MFEANVKLIYPNDGSELQYLQAARPTPPPSSQSPFTVVSPTFQEPPYNPLTTLMRPCILPLG